MKQKRAARKRARCTEVAAVSAKQQRTQARMTKKENREHKSSVFADLFYEDETAEKNLLSLYNALHRNESQVLEASGKDSHPGIIYFLQWN